MRTKRRLLKMAWHLLALGLPPLCIPTVRWRWCFITPCGRRIHSAHKRTTETLAWLELAAVCGAAWLAQMLPTVLAQRLDSQLCLREHFNWINGRDDGAEGRYFLVLHQK